MASDVRHTSLGGITYCAVDGSLGALREGKAQARPGEKGKETLLQNLGILSVHVHSTQEELIAPKKLQSEKKLQTVFMSPVSFVHFML